jgi:peptidoglycan/LPS O-acetylase OafA/YrhL
MTAETLPETLDDRPHVALHGLRFLAAVCILTSHWSEGLRNLTHQFMPQNGICVDFFFAIEGYLTAGMLLRTGPETKLWPLLARQYAKVLPLFWLGLLIGLIFAIGFSVPLVLPDRPQPTMSVIGLYGAVNAALVPVFPSPQGMVFPLDPPAWAIILEVYVFTLMCLVRRWLNLPVTLAVSAVGAVIYAVLALHLHDANLGYKTVGYWGGWPRCLFGFFGGAGLYFIHQRYGRIVPRLNPLVLWVAFLVLQFVGLHKISLPLALVGMPVLVWLAVAATDPSWLGSIGKQAGRMAYALYLLPFPVVTALRALADHYHVAYTPLTNLLNYLVVCAVILPMVYLATRFIAEPLARRVEMALRPNGSHTP